MIPLTLAALGIVACCSVDEPSRSDPARAATSDVLAVSVFDGQDTHRWGPFLSPRYSLLAAMYF